MQVDRSGYYHWLRRGPVLTPHQIQRHRQAAQVKQVFVEQKGKVGSRMIMHQLRGAGERIGRYRVRQLMAEQGLVCRIRKRYQRAVYRRDRAWVFDHPLRQCGVTALDQAWVIDISQVQTTEGWLYLSALLDRYSRRVIAHRCAHHRRGELVVDTLRQAARQRLPEGVIVHSDQGGQFTSYDWHEAINDFAAIGSMSAKGHCYDNAVMERFFGTLKDALVVGEPLVSYHEMKRKIQRWVIDYNHCRLHSALDYQTPAAFERDFVAKAA